MIYVLIDSCTLLQLIAVNGYNEHISLLTDAVNNERIKLLTHGHILQEWEKHKAKHLRKKEQRLISSRTESEPETANNLLPSRNTTNTLHLGLQTEQIDALLQQATLLETPSIISDEFAGRYRNRLAPFHNKKDSLNDWEMIGSACYYCELRNIPVIYFLSHNHTDFADEQNMDRYIHPTLQQRFPSVKIEYFKNYSDFFNEFDSVDKLPHHLILFQLKNNDRYTLKTTIRKTDLESLLFIYQDLYSEINFIPTHILSGYFPFSANEESRAYYSFFSMQNVRDQLLDLFENVKISGTDIFFKESIPLERLNEREEQIKYVLSRLTQNLVFNISTHQNRLASTYYIQHQICHCARCSFDRFDFEQAFSQLESETNVLKEELKTAYIQCQIGNFKSSAERYLRIASQAHSEKKYLTYFIVKYNLKHLTFYLNNFFYNDNVDKELVSKLSEIDPIEEAVKLKGHTDYNFLSFVAQEDYFNDAFQEIADVANEIQSHYYSQLNGGWSSNQKITVLTNAFAKLDTFINSNSILFNQYRNFKKLLEIVVEALFASHAISESQGERLEAFDDYWIHKMIVHGDKNIIITLFNRYDLKAMKYKTTGKAKDSFLELAQNLFKNSPDAIKSKENIDKGNRYFGNYYNTVFENLLTMAALLELDNETINLFAEHLLDFLKSGKTIQNSSFSSIVLFIRRKGESFKDSVLKTYFSVFFHDERVKHGDVFEAVVKRIRKRVSLFSDDDLLAVVNFAVTKCSKCQQHHSPEILVDLFKYSDGHIKYQIALQIQKELNREFNFRLYYLTLMNDVIPFKEERLLQLINEFNPDAERHTFRSIFSGRKDLHDDYLNSLTNICFKFHVNTTVTLEKFKRVSKYYEWLVDLDKFDYSQFNPEWVLEHQTTYFLRAFASSEKCLFALREHLKHNSHAGIENVLLKMTNFTD